MRRLTSNWPAAWSALARPVEPRQREVEEALVQALLQDSDPTVRDEARLALEQLEDPEVLERLHTLVDEGLLS